MSEPAPDYATEYYEGQVSQPVTSPEPVPVYIVETGDRADIRAWIGDAITITDKISQIASASPTRKSIEITNTGPNPVYLGATSSVTSSTGYPIALNASRTFLHTSAMFAICATGETARLGLSVEWVTGA